MIVWVCVGGWRLAKTLELGNSNNLDPCTHILGPMHLALQSSDLPIIGTVFPTHIQTGK